MGTVSANVVCLIRSSCEASLGDWAAINDAGCSCIQVPGASQALNECRRTRPLMVMVDDQTAWQDKGEIFFYLRSLAENRSVPLVLLASEGTAPELIEDCWRAGMDDCIVRPVLPEHVRQRVAAVQRAGADDATPRGRRSLRRVVVAGEDAVYRTRLIDLLSHSGYHAWADGTPDAASALRLGKLDLLVYVDGGSGRFAVGRLSELLSAARAAAPMERLPILVVTDAWSDLNAAGGPDYPGFQVIRRATPIEGVVQHINGMVQRAFDNLRAEARLPFFCPVQFREAGGAIPGPWCSGYSFNVSWGGIFIKTLVPPRAGAAVELKIRLTSTREEIEASGVVAWANRYASRQLLSFPVGMGVQYLGAISRKLADLIDLCRAGKPV